MKWTRNLVLGSLLLGVCPAEGLAGDGLVALQTADPSCPDDSGDIYVDCGNGTVTDNRTGLVWLARANCASSCSTSFLTCSADGDCPVGETCEPTPMDWNTAMGFVAGLKDISSDSDQAAHDCGLSDGSSPGEWRLPSLAEWKEMIALALELDLGCTVSGAGDPPAITNDSGGGCWIGGPSSFVGVASASYWPSTTSTSNTGSAWFVNLNSGGVGITDKVTNLHVWPVRGGQ